MKYDKLKTNKEIELEEKIKKYKKPIKKITTNISQKYRYNVKMNEIEDIEEISYFEKSGIGTIIIKFYGGLRIRYDLDKDDVMYAYYSNSDYLA